MTTPSRAVQFSGTRPLSSWLKRNEMTLNEFARLTGLEIASLYRLTHSQRAFVTVDMAFRIEDATAGAVPARKWCRQTKKGSALVCTAPSTESGLDRVSGRDIPHEPEGARQTGADRPSHHVAQAGQR